MRLLQYNNGTNDVENERQINFLKKAPFKCDLLNAATWKEINSINNLVFEAEGSDFQGTFCCEEGRKVEEVD